MAEPPSGTVTFLFTDLEGSTRRWEALPEAMARALARHDAILREGIARHAGYVFKTVGDGFYAAFAEAQDATAAAIAAQRALAIEPWGDSSPGAVRMALHTGVADERDGDYFGPPLNRAARMLGAAHGGQILLSATTAELMRDRLPAETELRDLGEHLLADLARAEPIHQLCARDLPSDFPPLASAGAFRHNLPLQVTSFVGRDAAMADVTRLLAETRLLTLIGSGGVGKTRLAFQVAADVVKDYRDGVWSVELASLTDPALVLHAVAAMFNIRDEPGRPVRQALEEFLTGRRLLLLLDNCEHVIDACAGLVDAIMRRCPEVRLLATSREALAVAGETVYRVPSLSLPDARRPMSMETLAEVEAARLFVERATAARPTFAITEENAPAVAQICTRLDGIPLAIEFAASRVQMFTAEQIAGRLDDRFRLLTRGSRTALPRQQTLRAALDWSWDLLTEPERAMLRRLSVFAGGFALEAAEAVCEDDDALDLLTRLVEKSLVLAEERDGTVRYRLLETVRHFGAEHLTSAGELETVRYEHLAWSLALARQAEPNLTTPDQGIWLDTLDTEHDNLREALSWSVESKQVEQGLTLAGALGRFWIVRGHLSEGRRWLERLLNTREAAPPATLAKSTNVAGGLAYLQGDHERAMHLYRQALEIRRTLGDERAVAAALTNLGTVAFAREEYSAVEDLYVEALAIQRDLSDERGMSITLNNLGTAAYYRHDYDAAKRYYEESMMMKETSGDLHGGAVALTNLADVLYAEDKGEDAYSCYRRALHVFLDYGDKRWVAAVLKGTACVMSDRGESERATVLFACAEALRAEIGVPLPVGELDSYSGHIAALRASLDETAFAAAWQRGATVSLEEACEHALIDTVTTM